MTKKAKILVCVSQSDHCLAALKYASLKAKKLGAHIEILSVLDTTGKDYKLFAVDQVIKQEKRENLEEHINEFSKKVHDWSGIKPIINIREGYISDEIFSVLEKDKAVSLIVIASSPESTSKGKLLNYLTEQVYSKLFIPMTVIPSNIEDSCLKKII